MYLVISVRYAHVVGVHYDIWRLNVTLREFAKKRPDSPLKHLLDLAEKEGKCGDDVGKIEEYVKRKCHPRAKFILERGIRDWKDAREVIYTTRDRNDSEGHIPGKQDEGSSEEAL